MANSFTLDLTVGHKYAAEAVKGVLGTILFHRQFHTVISKTVDILEVTVPTLGNTQLDETLTSKAAEFVDGLPNQHGASSQMMVLLYERLPKKSWFGTGTVNPWEQWLVNVVITESKDSYHASSTSLECALEQIVQAVNLRSLSYLPPVAADSGNYPYDIVIPTSTEGWGSLLKRMIVENISGGD
ncbi:autophagy associated HORMA domain protein Atg101 [Schizosaccharomyces osmophilus]|uniref:Autophagy-related protein 101 n=1 Tax=Schizosaccharomyces osmophilus TaxID=2545709 RepID=A0AAF0AX68_9SCHI|nr:autophagy associated HORMA domain protein Atg101 [Schizosaccharomyces osmophilus]WBW73579.1 autophagy associated HORMA domain protein Atg101 [Schizosaccharomyces osmophilus]